MAATVKDLVFRLAIPDHSPATLNPGFLQGAAIVPQEWALAQDPISTAEGSQLVFENGLILVAQGPALSGQEQLDRPEVPEPRLSELLARYCQALPLLDYRGLQTQLRAVVVFEHDEDEARRMLCERLLQPGSWQSFGSGAMQPTLQLSYPLEGQVLALTVAAAQLRQEGAPIGSALVFAGTFEQLVSEGEKLPQIQAMLRDWPSRRDLLLDLIDNHFSLT